MEVKMERTAGGQGSQLPCSQFTSPLNPNQDAKRRRKTEEGLFMGPTWAESVTRGARQAGIPQTL